MVSGQITNHGINIEKNIFYKNEYRQHERSNQAKK